MFLPKSGELIGKFVYAIVVTLIVVIISLQLQKIFKKKIAVKSYFYK
jgi:hypothetical protein